MPRNSAVIFCILLISASLLAAASLDKAKSLRANGLREEAKKELVDVLFQSDAPDVDKAEALLLLGEIAVDEKNVDAARENWNKLVTVYPDTPSAASARAKLEVLAQLVASVAPVGQPTTYPPGTVLVIGPSKFPWSAPRIAAALGPHALTFEGSLDQAVKAASASPSVVGLAELALEVDTVFESGRVVCYNPSGSKVWEKKVRVSSPGGEEHIARHFVDKLSTRIKGKNCP